MVGTDDKTLNEKCGIGWPLRSELVRESVRLELAGRSDQAKGLGWLSASEQGERADRNFEPLGTLNPLSANLDESRKRLVNERWISFKKKGNSGI